MTAAPLLEARGLDTAYGAVPVLRDVTLQVHAGEAVSLLGRNGMGKTTTLRAIMGLVPAGRGQVRIEGREVAAAHPHRRGRAGLAFVPEGRGLFPGLTVREHLVMAARPGGDGQDAWPLARVYALFPQLAGRERQEATRLSGGEQQMLSIARALRTNPRLLILDEATEGLAPLVRDEVWRVLRQLRAAGLALIVVDKNVRSLLALTDRTVILVRGTVVFDGDNARLAAQPDLLQRHLGV